MKMIDPHLYEKLAMLTRAARGLDPCDLVIVNANVVDVALERTTPGEIWVKNGVIVHVERDESQFGKSRATVTYDAKGAYAAPGLMDSHVHIESSMLSPYFFGRAAVVHGTTSVFTDPHEICNATGENGIRYMYENGREDPCMRQFILIPSCVPAVPSLESAGAEIVGRDVERIASRFPDAVAGLAEVMDYIGVVNGDARMAGVLNAARRKGLYMQSHFMGLHGKDLSAYHLTGLGGNHELRNADDVTEVLEAGGWVDMCGSSSIADTLDNLLPAIKAFPNPSILNVTLCTDDVHAADLIDRKHGHINKVVARVIKAGLKPETAIAFATRNIAREYGIDNLGVIKPGNLADVIIFDSFETLEPTAVFVGGRLEAENGKPVKPLDAELSRPSANLQEKVGATMRLSPVKPEALIPAAENNRDTVTVNTISFNGLFSKKGQVTLPAVNGRPDITGRDDLCYVAVLDRYGKDTVALGVLENYGLTCGAAATTVSHDSHNLTLIYKDASLAAFIANQVIEAGGGIAAGTGTGPGECHIIKLPIGGLMSYSSAEELSPQIHALEEYLPRLFNGRQVSMLQMAILTLPVVPEARITNMGIVNTVTQEFIPLFQ